MAGDGRYIEISDSGNVSLNIDHVREDIVDASFQLHESSILALDSSVYALETSVNLLETAVEQLEVSVNTLEDRLTDDEEAINASITRLDTSVEQLNASTRMLDVSVNLLEAALKDTSSEINASIDRLNTSVSAIEDSYVKDASLKVPSSETDQFNTLTLTVRKDGVDSDVSVDIANSSFYDALNDTIDVLSANDQYLASLLTWETL